MAQRQIPEQRQGIYYLGLGIGMIGLLLFVSPIFLAVRNAGEFKGPHEAKSTFTAIVTLAMTGFGMLIVSKIMVRVGRFGWAGAGITLDPEEARRDVEPWSRMAGGVVKDAMDEAGVELRGQSANDELPFDERLRRLQKLRDEGLVTEHEFEMTKKKILESA